MHLIGSCPPLILQDYFRNLYAFSEFSLESWILCLNLNQFFPFMVWAPSLQSAHRAEVTQAIYVTLYFPGILQATGSKNKTAFKYTTLCHCLTPAGN